MGWSHPEGKEIFSIDEFIEKLDLKRISPVGPAFDIVKLEWVNGEYIRAMSDETLAKRLSDYLKDLDKWAKDVPTPEQLIKIVPLIKERIKKLSDFIPLTSFLFEKPEYDLEFFNKVKIEKKSEVLGKVSQKLEEMEKTWKAEIFEETFRKLAEELNIPVRECFQLIRVAVSGNVVSPPLFGSIQLLGEEETKNRVKESIKFLG